MSLVGRGKLGKLQYQQFSLFQSIPLKNLNLERMTFPNHTSSRIGFKVEQEELRARIFAEKLSHTKVSKPVVRRFDFYHRHMNLGGQMKDEPASKGEDTSIKKGDMNCVDKR